MKKYCKIKKYVIPRNPTNNNSKFYEKISFWIYFSVWVITVAVALITIAFMSDKEAVSGLSLFGSISSIILAFLAIIYSYILTSKQGDAERYMQYTLKKIEQQLDALIE